MSPPIQIVDHKEMDLSAALVVVGFPGIGLVGSIAANYLIAALNLQRIASIISPDFPPMAVLKGGRVSSPARIHAAPMVCGESGKCNQLAVVMSDFPPRAEILHELCQELLSWCLDKKVLEIVVLEGLTRPEGGTDSYVYGAANNQMALDRLERLNVRSMGEGIISGLSGLLSYLGEARGLNVTCLLAETTKDFPDARSAAKLLEVLDPLLPQIKIDAKPLYRQAEAIEGYLKTSLRKHQESIADIAERSKIMYG